MLTNDVTLNFSLIISKVFSTLEDISLQKHTMKIPDVRLMYDTVFDVNVIYF